MKPPPFSYHDPRAIGEVVELLGRLDNAKLLAGGQSLMPMLNLRFVLPDHVIDLNRVEGLSFIREADGALEIGGMTRQRDLEFSDLIRSEEFVIVPVALLMFAVGLNPQFVFNIFNATVIQMARLLA